MTLDPRQRYDNPLVERYASPEMSRLFSAETKFRTWRRLWVALAEAERELGLPITAAQVAELRRAQDDVNYDEADALERTLRHDVMAHIRAYGLQCPAAKGVIHLGATSAYVVDNTDLILLRDALDLIRARLVNAIDALARFARTHRDVPTVGYTHFQPAQFTTVGRRACLWLQELLLDLDHLEHHRGALRFLGVKGAVGTQASFLALFRGNADRVRRLDLGVARRMGFPGVYAVSGQTYSRKVDAFALGVLAGIAQSAHKFSNDIRLLQHLRQVEEPFREEQVGSSAMAYKRNPMMSERLASLSRHVITLAPGAQYTAALQWFERTLDDSAGKRIATPEAFLAADAALLLLTAIVRGAVVHRSVIEAAVREELPSILTENLLMEAVKRGGDRQALHERIRRHAMAAAERRKAGKSSDLVARLRRDPAFGFAARSWKRLLDPRGYIGRSPAQVDEFLTREVAPRLRRHRGLLGREADIRV